MKGKNKKTCKVCGKEIDKGDKECPHCGKVQVNFLDKHRTITIVIILIIILSIVSIVVPISETSNTLNDNIPETTSNSTTSTEVTESTSATDKQSDKEVSKKEEYSKEEKDDSIISAHKLATAYNNNQEKADKLYKGKVETIKGRITDIGVTKGKTYFMLDSDDPFSAVKVECLFNEQSEIDKLPDLAKGEEVTIQGKVLGQSANINVEVKDCVIK